MSTRDDKAASLLVHLAGDFIAREAGRETLITPTRADIGRDRKNVTIYVSVFPDSDAEHALKFLERNTGEFRTFLKKESRLSILPYIKFVQDKGELNRQHLDELSREL